MQRRVIIRSQVCASGLGGHTLLCAITSGVLPTLGFIAAHNITPFLLAQLALKILSTYLTI